MKGWRNARWLNVLTFLAASTETLTRGLPLPLSFPRRSLKSRRRCSAATSPPTTSSSSPAPETRRPQFTKSSTEFRLAGMEIDQRMNEWMNKWRAKCRGGEVEASSCTTDCTQRRWLRKLRTLGSYFVLLFTFGEREMERERDGSEAGEGAGCKVTCLDINKLWFLCSENAG